MPKITIENYQSLIEQSKKFESNYRAVISILGSYAFNQDNPDFKLSLQILGDEIKKRIEGGEEIFLSYKNNQDFFELTRCLDEMSNKGLVDILVAQDSIGIKLNDNLTKKLFGQTF